MYILTTYIYIYILSNLVQLAARDGPAESRLQVLYVCI